MLANTITIAREQRDGLYELVRRVGDQEDLMRHVMTQCRIRRRCRLWGDLLRRGRALLVTDAGSHRGASRIDLALPA